MLRRLVSLRPFASAASARFESALSDAHTPSRPRRRAISAESSSRPATVFNPFSGCVVRLASQQVRSLSEVGIGVAGEQLVVVDPVLLNDFAASLSDERSIPTHWPKRMRHTLGQILLRPSATSTLSPAELVQQAIEQHHSHRQRSRMAGVIGEVSEEQLHTVAALNRGQENAARLAEQGLNVYVGGTGGTGKTEVIRTIRKRLTERGLVVGVVASTGIAAVNVGGVTLHSKLGLSQRGEFNGLDRCLTLDALIIDEVSMLDRTVFDGLDAALRKARSDSRPFGGLQIIASGDPLQLEPVANDAIVKRYLDLSSAAAGTAAANPRSGHRLELFFESVAFRDSFEKVMLTEQVRQAGHETFAEGLRQLRQGLWPAQFDTCIRHVDPKVATEDEEVLQVVGTNKVVDEINTERLSRLTTPPVTMSSFTEPARLTGEWTPSVVMQVKRPAEFDETSFRQGIFEALRQKVPTLRFADVIGYSYLQDGYVLRVRISPAMEAADVPTLNRRFAQVVANIATISKETAAVLQVTPSGDGLVPLHIDSTLASMAADHPVARATTIKEGCRVMLRRNLSDRLVNGIVGTVVGFVPVDHEHLPGALAAQPWAAASLAAYSEHMKLYRGVDMPLMPVVKFANLPDTVAIPPTPIPVGGCALTHYYEMVTTAVPLTPAYASTVHKAQGLTLLCDVRVRMETMWKCNHLVYVALSRVRSPDQVTVSGFKAELVQANPKALEFDQTLTPAPEALPPRPDEAVTRCEWYTAVESALPHATTPSAAAASETAGASLSPVLRKRREGGALGRPQTVREAQLEKVLRRHVSKHSSAKEIKARRLEQAKLEARGINVPLMLRNTQ